MDKETEERINRPIPHQEFPKMLHHTDGSHVIVHDEEAESRHLGSGNYHPTPQEAIDEKAKRDAAEAAREAQKAAKEAQAAGKKIER